MNALKRALLAGTMLPVLAMAPGLAETLPSGRLEVAQLNPQQDRDPRQQRPGGQGQQGRPPEGRAPGGGGGGQVQQPRPPQGGFGGGGGGQVQQPRPPVAPVQQPQRQVQPERQAPPIQQRPPVQQPPQQQRIAPPVQSQQPQRTAPPIAQPTQPTPPRVNPPSGVQPPRGPGFTGQPPGQGQQPGAGQAPRPGLGQPQPNRVTPPAAAGDGQRPTPGAIRPQDGRPPFGGNPPGQTAQPPVQRPGAVPQTGGSQQPPAGQPPIGQRPPGVVPGQPQTGGAQQPPTGQPPIGQRPPGVIPGQPGQPQTGGAQQPPAGQPPIGQRPPGVVPGQPQTGGAQQPPTGQPPIGQRPPGVVPGQPGQPQTGGAQQPPTGQPPIGQRPPGVVPGQPGQPQIGGPAQPPGLPNQPQTGGPAQSPALPPGQGFGQQRPGGPGAPGGFQGQPGQPGVGVPGGFAGQPPRQGPPEQRRGSRIGPAGAAAIGIGAGLVGGFMLSRGARAERVDEIRDSRREFTQDGVTVIHEPGRTIIRDGEGTFIRHDETARFRELGGNFRTERRGNEMVSVFDRPDGVRVITVTDESGELVRRIRRYPDGREVILIDNSFRPRPRTFEEQIIELPPPEYSFPRNRYIVDADEASPEVIYEALSAPLVQRPPRRYTLDEVRYSPTVRAYTRSVDVNTITFDTGSWEIKPDQVRRLDTIAAALGRAITANPNEVFLIEGHTDAVGNDVDNLSLSDRRAQSIATALTQTYNIPPENLTTQGYGEQNLKVQTQGPSAENRRVTLRRITDLLNQQNTQAPQ